jgi:Fe-S cluster assembly iron-binding protein IscA
MQLENFIGKHVISGVDFDTIKYDGNYSIESNCINVIIDSKTYSFIEDSSDEYRSMLSEIIESNTKVKNVFPSIEVIGIWRKDTVHKKIQQ